MHLLITEAGSLKQDTQQIQWSGALAVWQVQKEVVE